MESRRSDIQITYQGKDITLDLKTYLKSFTYTDCASGKADTITLGIADYEGKWRSTWFPENTDTISATVQVSNWLKEGDDWQFDCGTFTVDNVNFDGPPTILRLEAISTPASESFNCRKNTKTWEKTTINSIAAQIANATGISLVYDAPNVTIKVLEQSEETDMSFLDKLCKDYGLGMKAYSNKLIIFDEERYEQKATVKTLTELDVISWSGNTTLIGVADSATVKYTDSKTGKDVSYTYTATKTTSRKSRKLQESNVKADNLTDAQHKAKAMVRAANREETTMSLTMDAHKGLVATNCVDITGFGKFDGKYFIEKISHQLENGYKMQLEVRRVG